LVDPQDDKGVVVIVVCKEYQNNPLSLKDSLEWIYIPLFLVYIEPVVYKVNIYIEYIHKYTTLPIN